MGPGEANYFRDYKRLGPIAKLATSYTDEDRRQLRQKGHQGMACEPLAPQNLPGGVSPHEVKDFFGQIDGDGAELLLHGTRPPRGSRMISCTDIIVADHSRSTQGRVHFINAPALPWVTTL